MLTSELDFPLPPELIAQEPARPRDAARMLHLSRAAARTPGEEFLWHRGVRELPKLLREGDLLVFNDSRVLRARLRGRKISGGKVEALLLREWARNEWEVLLKPSARLKTGSEVLFHAPNDDSFGDDSSLGKSSSLQSPTVSATLLERHAESWRVRFSPPEGEFSFGGDIRDWLPHLGEIPIPPYIKTAPREGEYQTVYARQANAKGQLGSSGGENPLDSAAAPTAGLHFTPELLQALKARGVQTAFVTLGVGVGTFRPVQTETLEEHAMHEEEYSVSRETAGIINAQKQNGGRVIAVGTTTTRVLESIADENGQIAEGPGSTSIFIRPGHHFRCMDALMTNFHLPRSTLVALVAAFVEDGLSEKNDSPRALDLTGLEIVRYAYRLAIAEKYRFFSFGDSMLIE